MKKSILNKIFLISVPLIAVILVICLVIIPKIKSGDNDVENKTEADSDHKIDKMSTNDDSVRSAVDFDHELSKYQPKKDHYNFYFTYKTVHAWWDAVALGMEDAQRQFLDNGIVITYEYVAPNGASAADQIERLNKAAQGNYDVIGVDVADEELISPVINDMIDSGVKVMTFSRSDASADCKRIAYVGNTHNYEDGASLTEELCKKLDYKGKVAILVGSKGAPCHDKGGHGA